MPELSDATINTLLLLTVIGLVSLVTGIFAFGIRKVLIELKDMKHDLVEVKTSVSNIETWKSGKDDLDRERKENMERRLSNLETLSPVNPRRK